MDETTNLLLPYILAAQAQKHVTHNEALRKLDAIVQIAIIDRDLSSPPTSPVEGTRYIVGASPAGAWIGHQNEIAAWQDGAWAFYGPRTGWMAWIEDEEAAVVWDGTAWTAFGGGSLTLNPATGGLVGVNATADTTNRLSVSSPASLFNHAGAGHQMKVNKNAAADTASVLFQTGFSGRAEMGLAGSDDYSFKVSPNGSSWYDAILINRSTGACTFPNTPRREVLTAARSYYVRADGSDSNNGLTDSAGGAFLTVQKAVDTVASLDLSIFDATIFVGVGTWTAQTVLKSLVGAGRCIIRGINSNTVDTVFNVTGAVIFNASSGFQGTYHFAFLRTQTTTSGPHFNVAGGGNLQFGAIDFGPAPSSTHVQIGFGNFVLFQSNITISGSASAHIQAFDGGQIRQQSLTVTLTGTPAFNTFAVAGRGGTILANGSTYSGAATGTRFSATQAGGILTNTGSVSTAFAGSVNGSATSPGWFA